MMFTAFDFFDYTGIQYLARHSIWSESILHYVQETWYPLWNSLTPAVLGSAAVLARALPLQLANSVTYVILIFGDIMYPIKSVVVRFMLI